ncbi:FecR family protein [Pedobacter heparinus]|uniref:FecR family protein n=1 Tax=Pedobacter heparinus TaxID=984 RepID=UPI000687A0A3|nr:FecR family protein [Pedobacter heparinus]
MNTSNINNLLEKYLDGISTPEENAMLETWYMRYENKNLVQVADELRIDQLERIRMQMAQHSTRAKTIKLWSRIIGVAAAVAAIVFGVFFFKAPGNPEPGLGATNYTNDIAPGKNTATLTLANGKTILLSDVKTGVIVDASKLTYNDNTPVISNEERNLLNSTDKRSLPYGRDDGAGRSLTLTTPRGGTYQVRLPDGSKVWLNAASSLTYTAPLNERGGIRKVELSGEAYFEVFRNKNQPFVVTAKNLTTTVLGTHFNISAYDDENSTRATLLEGSVKVAAPGLSGKEAEAGSVIIKPNQQAFVTGSTGISVKEVDAEQAVAWKNGKFRFRETPLQEVMKQLARWYDVEVVYPDGIPDKKFTGGINRNVNVSEALGLFKFSGLKFTIENKKIIVKK